MITKLRLTKEKTVQNLVAVILILFFISVNTAYQTASATPSQQVVQRQRVISPDIVETTEQSVRRQRVVSPIIIETKEVKATVLQALKGFHKAGVSWLPLTVVLENKLASSNFTIEISNEIDGGTTSTNKTVYVGGSSAKVLKFHVFQTYESPLTLRIKKAGKVIAWSPVSIGYVWESGLAGVLSNSDDLSPFHALAGRLNYEIAELDNMDLPDYAAELSSLDLLILNNSDTSRLTEKQSKAITDWVSSGGLMFVFGGTGWKETIAGLDKKLLPVEPKGIISADFSMGEGSGSNRVYKSAAVTDADLSGGEIIKKSGENILVAGKRFGNGKVFWIGFDPAIISSDPSLYEKLIKNNIPGSSGQFFNYNGTNLFHRFNEGFQMISAKRFNLRGFLAYIVIYLIVLGPLNFLYLRRVKKKDLAWVTVPLVAVTFTLLSYGYSYAGKGTAVKIDQINIAHLDGNNGSEVRVVGMADIFSPGESNYDISHTNNTLLSLINRGYGPPSRTLSNDMVESSQFNALSSIRIGHWSTKRIVYDGYQKLDILPKLKTDFKLAENGLITGRIANNSKYSVEDIILWLDSKAYKIKRLEPGQDVEISLNGWKKMKVRDFFSDPMSFRRFDDGKSKREIFTNMILNESIQNGRGFQPVLLAWLKDAEELRLKLKDVSYKGFNDTVLVKSLNIQQVDANIKKGSFSTPAKLFQGWSECPTHKNQSYDFAHDLQPNKELAVTFLIPEYIRDYISDRDKINYIMEISSPPNTQVSVFDPSSGRWMMFPIKETAGKDKISFTGKPGLIDADGKISFRVQINSEHNDTVIVRNLEVSDI